MNSKIQELLERANSSSKPNSSVSYAKRTFSNALQAGEFFNKLKQKFFKIEAWNKNSPLSSFELFDKNGNVVHDKTLAVGDFICITLPGTGKDDWVKIVEIYETPDEVVLSVQPSFNPTEKTPDDSVTSHFFTDESANNFCFQKDDKIVSFYVIGINERTNTEDTKNTIETVRNFATANLGYFLGIQKGEWTTFCKNFLDSKNEK